MCVRLCTTLILFVWLLDQLSNGIKPNVIVNPLFQLLLGFSNMARSGLFMEKPLDS